MAGGRRPGRNVFICFTGFWFPVVWLRTLKETKSLCPKCRSIIPARVFEEDGRVLIEKKCEKHGAVNDVYWGDSAMYERASRFGVEGRGVENPNVDKKGQYCPFECGLCRRHKTHTGLGNIVLTNRCDLACWYCFFYQKEGDPLYEPSLEEIRGMLRNLRNEKPIGCTAVQLSVDADERILLQSPEGLIVSGRIGDFVDKMMNKNGCRKFLDPIPHEAGTASGWRVLSIDEKLEPVFKPIYSIIRHDNDRELFEIETDCGWKIRTTGSHSVFVLDEEARMSPKQVSELKKNDVLVGALAVPESAQHLREVDLLSLVVEEARENTSLLDKIRVCGFGKEELKSYEKESGIKINQGSVSLRQYLLSRTRKGSHLKYFNSKKGKELPFNIPVTPELCRLLGYYVGEGSLYRSGVIFSFGASEKETIADFLQCMKKVFGEINLRRRSDWGTAVQFYTEGYLYKLFFKLLGAGERADEKKVPWLVYNVSKDLKKEFLRAYFKCDGNVKMRRTGFEINHNTVSKELAADLVLLHAQLGITSKIEESVSKPHTVRKTGQFISRPSMKYRVVIGDKTELEKSLWYLDEEERKIFGKYVFSRERHAPSFQRIPFIRSVWELTMARTNNSRINCLIDRIRRDKSVSKTNLAEITDALRMEGKAFDDGLNDFSHSNLGVFRIRMIRKVKPASKHVYDLSVPGPQAFFAGLGPLLAHNTGGEPCMREDLVEIIEMAREEGFEHIQLNTNGTRLSKDLTLAKRVKEAGCNTLYLSFDGVTAKTNPKNHKTIPGVLENARKAGLGVVLVPTLIKGVNDHEIGAIVRFAAKNVDVVRSVNFQPVSIVGRVPSKQREKMRITIPDAVKDMEEQTGGEITRNDFYPVPCTSAVSNLAEAFSGRPQYEFSIHFACGMGTYVFVGEDGRLVPITRFVAVDEFFDRVQDIAEEVKNGGNKTVAKLKLLWNLRKLTKKSEAPKEMNLTRILFNALVKHDYRELGEFHKHFLFIGMMHFMDLYNYDVERVERCSIHYATPDGRIIPFCAFNVLPEIYRDAIQKKYSRPAASVLPA